jgi:hypothetical protein
VRHDRVGSSVQRRLQDHLVVGIFQLRPPLIEDPHWLNDTSKSNKKIMDASRLHPVDGAVFRAFQHFLIFQE